MNKWHQRFIDLAAHIAQWSKDPSTKVGAVLVDGNKRVIGVGYNGIPTGVDDNDERLFDREKKLMYFEHAERNVIYTAAARGINVSKCILYCTHIPCCDCARAIIQSGIGAVYYPEKNKNGLSERWHESIRATRKMFLESGIILDSV